MQRTKASPGNATGEQAGEHTWQLPGLSHSWLTENYRGVSERESKGGGQSAGSLKGSMRKMVCILHVQGSFRQSGLTDPLGTAKQQNR